MGTAAFVSFSHLALELCASPHPNDYAGSVNGTPPPSPLCMQEKPLCMHRTPSVWKFQGIPQKGLFSSREFQWEFQRFPTSGIPALGIPGS